jgi:hypothetical protein
MSTRPDYYLILGVPKTASAAEIKSAYRQLVKRWHPDVNSTKEATAKSQEINDAYSVLGSPERKALYDSGNYAAAVDPATRATEADFDPVTCDGCGAISAQPRFVRYVRVISIAIASFRSQPGGVFCVSCASKRLFLNTLFTGAVGWLGIWGIFWSLGALFTNLRGGIKPPDLNAFVLGRQSAYFLKNGHAELARTLAEESLRYFKKSSPADLNYRLGEIGAELANSVLQQPNLQAVKIKCKWKGWSSPARAALFGFSIPAIFWAAILGANDKKTDYPSNGSTSSSSQYSSPSSYTARNSSLSNTSGVKSGGSTSSRSPAVHPEPTVSFRNTNGITYSVSHYDALRLQPIYDSLQIRDRAIKAKAASLDLQNTNLEIDRSSITTESESAIFNRKVAKWNSDNHSRNLDVESYNEAVDSYNAELDRVGRKIN